MYAPPPAVVDGDLGKTEPAEVSVSMAEFKRALALIRRAKDDFLANNSLGLHYDMRDFLIEHQHLIPPPPR